MIKNTTNNHCSRHPNSNALTYCGACNKYMCAECKTYHDGFFGGEHEASVVPSERAIEDTEDQYNEKCKAHPEYPLDTMCNDCNCIQITLFFSILFHSIFFFFVQVCVVQNADGKESIRATILFP